MANKPISPLTQSLPTNWTSGQIVAPNGSDVGYEEKYGYNYLMQTVNAIIQAVNSINNAFEGLMANTGSIDLTKNVTGILPEADQRRIPL